MLYYWLMSANNKSTRIKAILFDLGRVIVDFDFTPAFLRLSRSCSTSPEKVRDYFHRSGLEVSFDAGKISNKDFYQTVKRSLGHTLNYREFTDVWNKIFTPNRAMIGLLRKLGPRYRLVLISNTNSMHYRYLRSRYKNTFQHFDRIILSFKEKVRKPDDRIYRKAIRACQAKPREIFYVDDREDLTDAAASLGLETFTFKNNPKELVRHMRRLDIHV